MTIGTCARTAVTPDLGRHLSDLNAIDRNYGRKRWRSLRPSNDIQRVIGRFTQYAKGLDATRRIALMAHLGSVTADNDFRKRLLKALVW